MNSMCDMGPDMYCVVDKKLTNTPKQISNLRGYGNIMTLTDTTKGKDTKTFNRIQPLCTKFGQHLPTNTKMLNTQTTLGWDNTMEAPVCNYQNENLNTIVSVNSHMPVKQNDKAEADNAETATMPTAPYYTTTGEFHTGKC